MSALAKFFIVTCIAVSAMVIILPAVSGQSDAVESSESKNSRQIPVTVMEVQQQSYAKLVVSSGTVRPVSEQSLAFKVAGVVDKVLVREGEQVKKGQLLALLALDEIDAQVAKADAVLVDAKRQLKRIEALKTKQLLSDEQSRQAETAARVAQNDLTIAKFNRKYAVIEAPSDGKILSRSIEPNELVQIGQQAFVFADESQGWQVEIAVADVDVVNLQLGDQAEVRLDAYPKQVFFGKVSEIAGRADVQSQTFAVNVHLNEMPGLLSGLIAHTSISPSRTESLTAVPLTALLRANDDNAEIYVLNANGEAEVRSIKLAYLDGGNAFVSKGLASKQTIIVDGAPYITDGKAINVVNAIGSGAL